MTFTTRLVLTMLFGLLPLLALAMPPSGAAPLSTVTHYTTPPLDREALLITHSRNRQTMPTPMAFADMYPVAITPASHGSWETLADGSRLWRLQIEAPGALSINLGFDRYQLPEGASLSLYSPDAAQQQGPYGAEHNHRGQLWTPIIEGDRLVIVVQIPAGEVDALDLRLSSINRGFREFRATEKSGSCNVDVACSQGDPWQSQISSVGRYSYSENGNMFVCSGTLINNTALDRKAYFLSANHCISDGTQAATIVVYWNYQNSTCRTPGSAASGETGDGPLNQTTLGSTLKATYGATDVTLLELDASPNPAYNIDWAGWEAQSVESYLGVFTIHHPRGQEKRISIENDTTNNTSYFEHDTDPSGTHIRVADWDLGTTETGSSGSPLFNSAGRIIGQLHGGFAACGNDESDWYGRLAISWDGGGDSASRLRDWLDPVGGGNSLTLSPLSAAGPNLILQDGFE